MPLGIHNESRIFSAVIPIPALFIPTLLSPMRQYKVSVSMVSPIRGLPGLYSPGFKFRVAEDFPQNKSRESPKLTFSLSILHSTWAIRVVSLEGVVLTVATRLFMSELNWGERKVMSLIMARTPNHSLPIKFNDASLMNSKFF